LSTFGPGFLRIDSRLLFNISASFLLVGAGLLARPRPLLLSLVGVPALLLFRELFGGDVTGLEILGDFIFLAVVAEAPALPFILCS